MRVRLIKREWIAACPVLTFLPDHYREDGTCLCFPASEDAS